jgi:hypothetical protein
MTKLIHLALAVLLTLALGGCGGNGDRGPGFVGIDDGDDANFAPLLTVSYIDPVTSFPATAQILSDPDFDGDIAFDPVLGVFTVTPSPLTVFFGIDSSDPNLSEFRAFLTFPLDGVTQQDVVPLGVTITNATLEVFVTEVRFANVVPTFLDLVDYGTLGAEDFDAPFLDFRTLDFFATDAGNFVLIQVTSLMQTAQDLALLDFQIRFSLDESVLPTGALSARPHAAQREADRTVSPFSAAKERPARRPPASAPPSGAGPEGPARNR